VGKASNHTLRAISQAEIPDPKNPPRCEFITAPPTCPEAATIVVEFDFRRGQVDPTGLKLSLGQAERRQVKCCALHASRFPIKRASAPPILPPPCGPLDGPEQSA